ncbi:MAG: DUF1795 domain-containing protein [Ruminococcus sp.]|nr:DUF1795 domain-containing protein [Ruminococcus sp.]
MLKMRNIVSAMLAAVMLMSVTACGSKDSKESSKAETTTAAGTTSATKAEEQQTNTESDQKNIIATSSKDISDIDVSFLDSVTNDVTGNWQCLIINSKIDFFDYALSIYNTYYEESKVLIVEDIPDEKSVNFSQIDSNTVEFVIHEYVDGEEKDANSMVAGSVIGQYWLYLDSGEIEDILNNSNKTPGTYSDGTFDCEYYSVTVDESKWGYTEGSDMDCLFNYIGKPDDDVYSASSLNVASFTEDTMEGMTVDDYADQIIAAYKDSEGYEVSKKNAELDGQEGIEITINFPMGESRMTIKQLIAIRNGAVIAVSYGAMDDIYKKMQKQFDEVIGGIKLK